MITEDEDASRSYRPRCCFNSCWFIVANTLRSDLTWSCFVLLMP